MNKQVLTIGLILLLVSVILFFITVSGVKEAAKEKWKTFLYQLLFGVLPSGVVLLAYTELQAYPIYLFLSFQACYFLLGILFCIILYRVLQWTREPHFGYELLFLFATALMGTGFYLLLYTYLFLSPYNYLFISSALFFIIPFLVYHTFEKAILIPRTKIKTWECPSDENVPYPSKYEMQKPFVVTLLLKKNPDEKKYKYYRAKAPREMPFGKLMFYFIKDYNTKHSEGPIFYNEEETGVPYEWVFYFKPRWYYPIVRYIDTDMLVQENKIKENSVIICKRVFSR